MPKSSVPGFPKMSRVIAITSLVLQIGLFSSSMAAPSSADQGEEVYQDNKPAAAPRTPTPAPASTPANKPTSTGNTSTSASQNSAPTTTTPAPSAPADTPASAPAASSTAPASADKTSSPSASSATDINASTNDDDKPEDLTVEKNQLVEGDDLPFATPKQNGVVWFAGIFLVLLVVFFLLI